jgi:hypothetical protein
MVSTVTYRRGRPAAGGALRWKFMLLVLVLVVQINRLAGWLSSTGGCYVLSRRPIMAAACRLPSQGCSSVMYPQPTCSRKHFGADARSRPRL